MSYLKIKDNAIQEIPKINEIYTFYDDGKTSPSRTYRVKIIEIIPYKEMKDKKILKVYKEEIKNCYWLYAEKTDYFIKAICKEYDDNYLYFIRTIDGGWFSFDYLHSWMSGRLIIKEKEGV